MQFMSRDDCVAFAAEVHAQLVATPSALGERILRSLIDYSVAFLVQEKGGGDPRPAGSGTTVSYRGIDYFLTASHVWHEKLKGAEVIAVPLKEDNKKHFTIKPSVVAAIGPDRPENWNEWGPDIVLLRIPPELVGKFRATGRSFHNLSNTIHPPSAWGIEYWFQIGAPADRGEYSVGRSVPEIDGILVDPSTGYFGPPTPTTAAKDEFDFIDLLIDTSGPDAFSRPHGISGGGLWRLYLYKSPEGETKWIRILDGVAFYELPREKSKKVGVRCHGPQSIGRVLKHLEEDENSSLWTG